MSKTYYAVCNANGPISVRLAATTIQAALEEFEAADGRAWIDGARADAEDDLDIEDAAEMDESAFDVALGAAGARPVKDLAEIINAHAGTVAHLSGGWFLWEHGAPTIEVLGIGTEFDPPEDAESDAEMEWYGNVRVSIDGIEYQVGAVIGVPESERGTCRAAGAGGGAHLDAWYADSSDWDSAPASNGSTGVPAELVSDVICAIGARAGKLWQEVRS